MVMNSKFVSYYKIVSIIWMKKNILNNFFFIFFVHGKHFAAWNNKHFSCCSIQSREGSNTDYIYWLKRSEDLEKPGVRENRARHVRVDHL